MTKLAGTICYDNGLNGLCSLGRFVPRKLRLVVIKLGARISGGKSVEGVLLILGGRCHDRRPFNPLPGPEM